MVVTYGHCMTHVYLAQGVVNRGDIFILNTQLVVSRGVYMLVELAENGNQGMRQPAIRALHYLTMTNRRFQSILFRATQDEKLLASVASGQTRTRTP